MSELTYMEFQREIQKRGIGEKEAFLFTLLYERLIETEKMVLEMAKMTGDFAGQLAQFITLREEDAKQLAEVQKRLHGFGKTPGVDVRSEPISEN